MDDERVPKPRVDLRASRPREELGRQIRDLIEWHVREVLIEVSDRVGRSVFAANGDPGLVEDVLGFEFSKILAIAEQRAQVDLDEERRNQE